MTAQVLTLSHYTFRRRFLSFLGIKADFFDDQNNKIGYSFAKPFKLREEMFIYEDESCQKKILSIKARNIVDFSAKYDISDSDTGAIIGTWQREGLKSLVRDSWKFETSDGKILELKEDSTALALVRRFLSNLIPQTYVLRDGTMTVATFRQHFNPFIYKLDVKIEDNYVSRYEKAVASGAFLLGTIEGRQQ